jgi:hypothetical protein
MPLRSFRSPKALLTSIGTVVALTTSLAACPGEQTINKVSQTLTIQQVEAGGGFTGFTGTSFSPAIPSGKKVTLLSATLTSSSGEFSWITSLVGTPTMSDAPILVEKTSFAGATSPTDLTVGYTGDLMPFYPTQDVRVYWTLQFAPTLTQSYPNGVQLTFSYELQIE